MCDTLELSLKTLIKLGFVANNKVLLAFCCHSGVFVLGVYLSQHLHQHPIISPRSELFTFVWKLRVGVLHMCNTAHLKLPIAITEKNLYLLHNACMTIHDQDSVCATQMSFLTSFCKTCLILAFDLVVLLICLNLNTNSGITWCAVVFESVLTLTNVPYYFPFWGTWHWYCICDFVFDR